MHATERMGPLLENVSTWNANAKKLAEDYQMHTPEETQQMRMAISGLVEAVRQLADEVDTLRAEHAGAE